MQNRWERTAKVAALLLPPVVLIATAVDPSLRVRLSETVTWVSLAMGFLAFAGFLAVVVRTESPSELTGPTLQDLSRDDQKLVKRAWRNDMPAPIHLAEHVRGYAHVQEVTLRRLVWIIASMGFFNINTALGNGTLRGLGLATMVYIAAMGLGTDFLVGRWQRVLRGLPREGSSVAGA